MRTLLQPVLGVLCLAVMAVSCKKNKAEDPIPADVNNAIETKPPVQTANTVNVTANIQGYYSSVPFYYQYTTKSYPLLVFVPGGGQYGNGASDLPLLLNDGVAKLINNKAFPAAFSVDGKVYSFIVLTPQLKSLPSVEDITAFIQYAKSNFRVDASRIYVGGLSVGGQVSGDIAAAHPDQIAAILPISGESLLQTSATAIANNKIPVWDFHNSGDPTVNISISDNFIAWINAAHPAIPPKRTVFQSNQHDAWTKALDPTYKEFGMNVYEWLLQYAK